MTAPTPAAPLAATTKPPTRWGVVGCGWVARDFFAPQLGDMPLVHAVDPDPAARAAIGARRASADLAPLLDDPEVDAVYVATPNDLHLPVVERLAAAGKDVLCEKPLARTLDEAERLVQAAKAGGIRLATAFEQRHHPAHVALRDLVPLLGTVTAIRIVYCCWVGPDWAADNWRADPERAGGGALIDLAPHGLDLAQELLGERLVDVHATKQRRVHPYPVDDGALVTAQSASGALVSLHVAYNHPEDLPRRRLEVVGTQGMAVGADTMGQEPGGRLRLLRAGKARTVDFDTTTSPFAAQARWFASASPGDLDPGRDLHTMALLDACR